MFRNFKVILICLLCLPLTAVDIYVPDFQETNRNIVNNNFTPLCEHAQLLIDSQVFNQASQFDEVLGNKILPNTNSAHLYLGRNPQEWLVQLQIKNKNHLQAWWQSQLEQLQRNVPGLGIERNGLHLSRKANSVNIMGKRVQQLPQRRDMSHERADVIITGFGSEHVARMYFSDVGLRMSMQVPYAPENPLYIDKTFISELPQEMFAWCTLVINDDTRPLVLNNFDLLSTFVRPYVKNVSFDSIRQSLHKFEGELFLGMSHAKDGLDINIAMTRNHHSDQLVSTFIQGDAGVVRLSKQRELVVMQGKNRWIASTSIHIAQILSGKRHIHFPQMLPERISKEQEMVAAGYTNTLALAQKYYDMLPMMKQHSDRVDIQEITLLRQTLKRMVPHLQEAVCVAKHQDGELHIKGEGLGSACIMAFGSALCQQKAWQKNESDTSYIMETFESLTNEFKQQQAWPMRLAMPAHKRVNICYLRPEEDQDFDLPVLIENPARHNGRGSYVVFSNGEVQFFKGRAIWNRGQELVYEGASSNWVDWKNHQHLFRPLQDSSRRMGINDEEIQIMFEQLENDD